jgi:hypothetical protein
VQSVLTWPRLTAIVVVGAVLLLGLFLRSQS